MVGLDGSIVNVDIASNLVSAGLTYTLEKFSAHAANRVLRLEFLTHAVKTTTTQRLSSAHGDPCMTAGCQAYDLAEFPTRPCGDLPGVPPRRACPPRLGKTAALAPRTAAASGS